MGLFSNREEAEKKFQELQAAMEEKEVELEALNEKLKDMQSKADAVEAQAKEAVEAIKADFNERIEIAIAAGIATESIRAILSAEDIKSAALESIKAVKSDGATISATADIDNGDFTGDKESDRLAAIEAQVKKTIGKG